MSLAPTKSFEKLAEKTGDAKEAKETTKAQRHQEQEKG